MANQLFKKYLWLIETVGSGSFSFAEIAKKWQNTSFVNEDNDPLPERSFNNFREAIFSNFDIEIVYNRSSNTYSLLVDKAINKKQNFLLDLISTQLMILNCKEIDDRVILESIPQNDTKVIFKISEAMKSNSLIEINYNSFWGTAGIKRIKPYVLKLFKRRWYLVAEDVISNKIKLFVLSRISEIDILAETFKMPNDFSEISYFYNSFGIEHDSNIKAEPVKLKVYNHFRQVDYFRELPLHHSQHEEKTELDFSIFTYYISPTNDFIREILSKGNEVEVISPQWLREKIKISVEQTLNRYK